MARFERLSPVLPVRDVAAAIDRFRALGFEGRPYEEVGPNGPIYGFVRRDDLELHLACVTDLDPCTNTSAVYVYVDDAAALHAEWAAANVGGRLHPPVDTPYGLREFAWVDPDGNLLRVGSSIP